MADANLTLENIEFHPFPNNPRFKNRTGIVKGRLTILGYAGKERRVSKEYDYWYCICECGSVVKMSNSHLCPSSRIVSCGCYMRDIRPTLKKKDPNALCRNKTYAIYKNLKQRCSNPNHKDYDNYGGRGIRCMFSSFQEFADEIGERPGVGYTVERIENNGHYEAGNVVWHTRREQARNRRDNIVYQGEIAKDASARLGLSMSGVCCRVTFYGWCKHCAFTIRKGGGTCPHRKCQDLDTSTAITPGVELP